MADSFAETCSVMMNTQHSYITHMAPGKAEILACKCGSSFLQAPKQSSVMDSRNRESKMEPGCSGQSCW